MLKFLLIGLLAFQCQSIVIEDIESNVGIAQNEHYVEFIDGQGYYIEESGVVNKQDVVYITEDGQIYIIDYIKENVQNNLIENFGESN